MIEIPRFSEIISSSDDDYSEAVRSSYLNAPFEGPIKPIEKYTKDDKQAHGNPLVIGAKCPGFFTMINERAQTWHLPTT